MVRLTKIYTRGGDSGETSLGGGTRRAKYDLRIAAYGTVDEANASLGIARLHVGAEITDPLARIQNDLFDLGADLCRPQEEPVSDGPASGPLRVTAGQVTWLEGQIDDLNADLEPLNTFVLPGGSAAAAHLHLSRTIVRRAERIVAELAAQTPINSEVLKYLNRLSDYLFVVSRHQNGRGKGDHLWIPGEHR